MTALYGQKWSSVHGETPEEGSGKTWQTGLVGITATDLSVGLQACLMRDDTWPPTLPEFVKLCRPKADTHESDWKKNRPDPKKMPSPERKAWHEANIAWIEAGGELPRPGSIEPPGPVGCRSFWDIYKGPDAREPVFP